ncbi:hypothetical protein [Pseudoalteromonas umbrosa]|uniref:hypothetical protein n=1 Tax=Pseudoalteromonas umbrosa TaxID=3048489 RepID=UPI0024C4267E|nr:hypothetical protein [Pseudoalteromonas sp. B95]MDK1287385.1 hypothetical protein [Pseudoalteromonas sp. B95]
MATQAKTLEEQLTELYSINGELVSANEQLTATVIGKMQDIDTKVAQAKSALDTKFIDSQNNFNTFMNTANRKYQGSGAVIDAQLNAESGVDIAPKVHELFEAGNQNVKVNIPENTTCYWGSTIMIPVGCGLTIQGSNQETSQIKFRAFHKQYDDKSYHYIAPMRLSAGANIRVRTVTLEQEILEGATAAPYRHGMFNIPSYNSDMGDIGFYFSHTTFKTYDCIVHPEGVGIGNISVTFVGCELHRVSNPGWFTSKQNCAWLGAGSWSHQGRYLSCTKHGCKQVGSTETGKVCDIIRVWNDGTDLTQTKFTQANNTTHFHGVL